MKLLLIYLLLAGSVALSQLITTATINGQVSDSSGAAISQALIILTNQETGTGTKTQSNSDGSFTLPGLQIGTYTVVVTRPGFETYSVKGIILHPATVATVNATLSAGQVQTQISVQAAAAQVETSTSEVSNQVSRQQVSTLPLNGRIIRAFQLSCRAWSM